MLQLAISEADIKIFDRNQDDIDRLKAFTDGVVAIALTLLILPLLETVSESVKNSLTTKQWYESNQEIIFLFTLSFILISLIWNNHTKIFVGVKYLTKLIKILNIVWLFSIVFLPVTTALIGMQNPDTTQIILYIGTLLLGQTMMSGISFILARNPHLMKENCLIDGEAIATSFSASLLYSLALLLSILVPSFGYASLLALLLMPLVSSAIVNMCQRVVLSQDGI